MKLKLFIIIVVLISFALCAKADDSADDGPTWNQLMIGATKALRANDLPQAIRFSDSALDIAGRSGTNKMRLSQSQVLRAEVYLWQKRNDLAEKTFELAVATCEQCAGSNSLAVIDPLSSLANFYHFVARRNDQAVSELERILRITETNTNSTRRDVIMWNRNLGILYQQTGKFTKAEPLFAKAVALSESDSDWHPHELLNAAEFYRAWKKFDRAEMLAQQALDLRENLMSNNTNVDVLLSIAICLNNLGATYFAAGEFEKAEKNYRRSLEITETFMPSDQSDLLPQILGLAEALQAQKKHREAELLFVRALANAEKNLGADDPALADVLEKYAVVLNDLGKTGEAKGMRARAKKIRHLTAKTV